jgi:hypothetical protein
VIERLCAIVAHESEARDTCEEYQGNCESSAQVFARSEHAEPGARLASRMTLALELPCVFPFLVLYSSDYLMHTRSVMMPTSSNGKPVSTSFALAYEGTNTIANKRFIGEATSLDGKVQLDLQPGWRGCGHIRAAVCGWSRVHRCGELTVPQGTRQRRGILRPRGFTRKQDVKR